MSQPSDRRLVSWYFDFISPFAYLQWQAVKDITACDISCRPILLAGLLKHHGHKGPAEIAGKRRFTYRHVAWRARQQGIGLRFPPAHPFNPLVALRLCIAAGTTRDAVDGIFNHIWREGQPCDSLDDVRHLAGQLGVADPDSAVASPEVKQALQHNFQEALDHGVFGVPTLVSGDALFWGEDATGMFKEWLEHPAMLDAPEFLRLDDLPVGVMRR